MEKNKTKFKVGDKVRILPSAIHIGVRESEVGTIQTIIKIIDSTIIDITDSDAGVGSWWVEPDQIESVIKVGQQLLLWEWV